MKTSLLAFIATLALSMGAAHAKKTAPKVDDDPLTAKQQAAPPPSPESEEDLSEDAAAMEKLRFMMAPGTYKCVGTSTPPGEHKSHPLLARVPVTSELDGHWQQVRYEEVKSAEHPHPAKAIQFFTYDVVNKVFLRTGVDSQGNSVSMTADNTDGERLTFTGHANVNGSRLPTRLVWEKLGKDVKLGWEWSPGEGNWFRAVDLTCHL